MRRMLSPSPGNRYLTPEKRKGKKLAPPTPYRSWLEADVVEDLKKRKIEFEYEKERVVFVEPAKVRTYIPDLSFPSGLIVEIKGRWTAQDRRKISYVLEQNPDKDIRILFDKDNTISRGSKTRYSDWCNKRNIKFAIGNKVPEEWFDDAS